MEIRNLDYEICMLFPGSQIKAILHEIAGLLVDNLGGLGRIMRSGGDLEDKKFTKLYHTVMRFESDAVLDDYIRDNWPDNFEDWVYPHNQVALQVDWYLRRPAGRDSDLALFEMSAPTQPASELFLTSTSIRAFCIRLLETYNGECAYFQDDCYCNYFEPLWPAHYQRPFLQSW